MGYDLVKQFTNPAFIEGLKLRQQGDLALDTANPQPDLIEAVIRLSDKVPGLRIIVDHLPAMAERLETVQANLRELAKRPVVYIKVSQVMRMVGGQPSGGAALYRPVLDRLFETFGEDKLLFGSDWPNQAAGIICR